MIPFKTIKIKAGQFLSDIAADLKIRDFNDLFKFNQEALSSNAEDEVIIDHNTIPEDTEIRVPDCTAEEFARHILAEELGPAEAEAWTGGQPFIDPLETVSYTVMRPRPAAKVEGLPWARFYVNVLDLDLRRYNEHTVQIIDPDTEERMHDEEWLPLDFRGSFKLRLPKKRYWVRIKNCDFQFHDPEDYRVFCESVLETQRHQMGMPEHLGSAPADTEQSP